jgi:hypothetical protein
MTTLFIQTHTLTHQIHTILSFRLEMIAFVSLLSCFLLLLLSFVARVHNASACIVCSAWPCDIHIVCAWCKCRAATPRWHLPLSSPRRLVITVLAHACLPTPSALPIGCAHVAVRAAVWWACVPPAAAMVVAAAVDAVT